jgi:hypothetical protein
MRYVLLRRNTGEIVLEGEQNLHLATHYYDTKEYENFPREPREPKAIPAPDLYALGGHPEWQDGGGRVWVFPDAEAEAKAKALMDAYKPVQEANLAARRAWWERKQKWEDRRRKAGEKALRRLDPKEQRYSFAGGSSAGRSLAPRVRLLRAADQRKFEELDKQIIRLHERRGALIEAAFGRGLKPTPEQLLNVAVKAKVERDRATKRNPRAWASFYGWKERLAGYWSRTPKPVAKAEEAREAA